jgi:predicted nuclease with TOPRIM domain
LRPARPTTVQPQGSPDPTLPTDVPTLQTHLRLARAQNAHLHRELATVLKQGPLAPSSFPSEVDALQAENVDLRQRLTLLTRHYEDLQRRYQQLKHTVEWQQKEIAELWSTLGVKQPRASQSTLVTAPVDVAHVLTTLLKLAHPDRWGQGQPATELAHEVTIAINATRAHMEVRP